MDDEEEIAQMAKQMLERLGYKVTARIGSQDPLESFGAQPNKFDLIINDMTMPNMTGVELSKRLKEIRQDTRIIIITGHSGRSIKTDRL